MSIRKHLSIDEQIQELTNKGLTINNKDSRAILKEYLQCYGYYAVVKKPDHHLMHENKMINQKYIKEFTSNNLRYLFDIDRNISIKVFKYFRSLEFKLNSALTKVLGQALEKKVKCPYFAAMEQKDFDDIFKNLFQNTTNKKKHENRLSVILFDELYRLIHDSWKKNKDSENAVVIKKIDNGWYRKDVEKDIRKKKWINNWEYVDCYSLFEVVNFSQMTRIFSYINNDLQSKVIDIFLDNCNGRDRLSNENFQVLLDILSDLRNLTCHNGYILDIDFSKINEMTNEANTKITHEDAISNIKKFFDISSDTFKLNEIIIIIEKIIKCFKINLEIINDVDEKINTRTHRGDRISPILFDIIKENSNISIPTKPIYFK